MNEEQEVLEVRRRHELKVIMPYFEPLHGRVKRFEVRYNDRNFKVGDSVVLREWIQGVGYTGRSITQDITYVLDDFHDGLQGGYVVLGLSS